MDLSRMGSDGLVPLGTSTVRMDLERMAPSRTGPHELVPRKMDPDRMA